MPLAIGSPDPTIPAVTNPVGWMRNAHRTAFAFAGTGLLPRDFGPQLFERNAFGDLIVQSAIKG